MDYIDGFMLSETGALCVHVVRMSCFCRIVEKEIHFRAVNKFVCVDSQIGDVDDNWIDIKDIYINSKSKIQVVKILRNMIQTVLNE